MLMFSPATFDMSQSSRWECVTAIKVFMRPLVVRLIPADSKWKPQMLATCLHQLRFCGLSALLWPLQRDPSAVPFLVSGGTPTALNSANCADPGPRFLALAPGQTPHDRNTNRSRALPDNRTALDYSHSHGTSGARSDRHVGRRRPLGG